jgi:xylitol oxidase
MQNWAESLTYSTADIVRPRTVAELSRVVTTHPQVKALGSRHSFSTCADTTGVLIDTRDLAAGIELDSDAGTVRVGAGTTYAELAVVLERAGRALPNLASLPHISVAGATQTGTHGSGPTNPSLASSVAAFDIVRADGEPETLTASHPEFDASVVGIGALGIVTSLTLATVPTFTVEQAVYEGIPWEAATAHWDALVSSAYSVSVFTTFTGPRIAQVWSKHRTGDPAGLDPADLGGRMSDVPLHPLPGTPATNVTRQMRQPGPWHERLPHFDAAFQPGRGDEIQSEYLLPAAAAVEAIEALRGIGHRIAPVLHISEIRTIAPDRAWLSPSHGRASVAFHFTWQRRPADVLAVVPLVEKALAPFTPRPHWGKVFTLDAETLRVAYPRLDDFAALAHRHDPIGRFGNTFLRDVLAPARGAVTP